MLNMEIESSHIRQLPFISRNESNDFRCHYLEKTLLIVLTMAIAALLID